MLLHDVDKDGIMASSHFNSASDLCIWPKTNEGFILRFILNMA